MNTCITIIGTEITYYLRFQGDASDVLFVLRFHGPVNSYGHVEPVSYSLTLFLGRLRATKRLTST